MYIGHDELIPEPAVPTNPPIAGYEFGGWLAGTVPWSFTSDTVTADVSLQAIWNAHGYYTVTFNSMGGTAVSPIPNVAFGGTTSAPTDPTSGYGAFDAWYSNSARTGAAFDFSTDTITGNITLYAKWIADYDIGDNGPGGGTIFYRNELGFPITDNGQICYYLEAAPADSGTTLRWALNGTPAYIDVPGTSKPIGTGRKNTALILAVAAPTPTNAPAANFCDTYTNNGYSDWFLPSYDELNELNKCKINSLIPDSVIPNVEYWTSTQGSSSATAAERWKLGDSTKYLNSAKTNAVRARPIRAF
jgi:uncharacterized repeat protein (TIGR02543 family)